ncbi:hypothetical protein [Erwinia persicina]|uniref:hypothetical protein n=1 Tax=Erwinia persicina TaxID=55211 RepID=UPI00177C03BF|nr:hypothetical protein [Erwinia persicina]MBD8214384.1 hypothetical protein [Erwinia persicina]
MKVLSLAEVSAVFGAGDMPAALQNWGLVLLLSYLKYVKEMGIDPLSSKVGGYLWVLVHFIVNGAIIWVSMLKKVQH